jgi:hypothetical protein
MAEGTIRSILAIMFIVLLVAGVAIRRRAFINIVDVTTRASYQGMFARQFEGSQVVVKGRREPSARRMAVPAICAKQGRMRVALFMAGNTTRWCSLKDTIYMTTDADNADMFPG